MTTDLYVLLVFEAVLAFLVLRSLLHWACIRLSKATFKPDTKRGSESRRQFGLAYGFASVLTLQFVNVSAAFVGHKVLLSVLNIAALFYLCFLADWFRNRLIGWLNWWEAKPER